MLTPLPLLLALIACSTGHGPGSGPESEKDPFEEDSGEEDSGEEDSGGAGGGDGGGAGAGDGGGAGAGDGGGDTSSDGFDDAVIVVAQLPAELDCGEASSGRITVLNTGTTDWTSAESYELISVGGADPLSGETALPLPSSPVEPGDQIYFYLTISAPTTAGSYQSSWQMARGGVGFGDPSEQVIAVVCR